VTESDRRGDRSRFFYPKTPAPEVFFESFCLCLRLWWYTYFCLIRPKNIARQKLSLPDAGERDVYPHLEPILTRPINWELIRRQYDEMIKFAVALKLGTADPEAILRRFTRDNTPQHPTYQALSELGRAIKTTFLCHYLSSEPMRREIQEGLNVVENWNGANAFIFYGKNGEIATNQLAEQELSVLSLHLLQICLVELFPNKFIVRCKALFGQK
jgi:TnpA family transposase